MKSFLIKPCCFLFLAFWAFPLQAVDVEWTGRDLEINGVKEIPLGLWGVMSTDRIHAPKRNGIEWVMDSWGDFRRPPLKAKKGELPKLLSIFDGDQPALQRVRPQAWEKWISHLMKLIPKENSPPMDFLLNPKGWERGHGINGYGKFFDESKAKAGGKVSLAGKEIEGLVWDQPKWILREYRGGLRMDWTARMVLEGKSFTMDEWFEPKLLKKGVKVKINNQWAEVDKVWWVKDSLPIPQRGVSWWSYNPKIWRSPLHAQNRKLFLQLVENWTKHPESVGSGKNVSFGWARPWFGSEAILWKDLIQPMIDLGGGNIFHLSDRIQGDPINKVMAGYELAWNYSKNLRHRDLSFRTMGIAGTLHPTSPDGRYSEPPLKGSEDYEIGSFLYQTKDILSRLMMMPHKADFRFLAEDEKGVGALAALEFLSSIKGQMTALEVNDPMVLAVSSRKGTKHRIALMNDDYKHKEISLGFSGYRFKSDKVKIVRPKLGGAFPVDEKEVTMTSLLSLKLKPREVILLSFETEKSTFPKRVVSQFPMKGKPRRHLSSLPLRFMVDFDEIQRGDRLVLRLNVDRPVSGLHLKEGKWSQEIHHSRDGLQDHTLNYVPTKKRWGFSLHAPSERALYEGASIFLVRDSD